MKNLRKQLLSAILVATMVSGSVPVYANNTAAENKKKLVGTEKTVEQTAVNAENEQVSMYRVYNPNSGEHFYTASAGEKKHLVRLGWHDEGTGWTAPKTSKKPVYRLYNKHGGEHHYTLSKGEQKHLVSVGWTDEGIGWYSDEKEAVPVYRQYNPNAFANNHNYTTSVGEKKHLISLGWHDEGIGWYGISTKKDNDLDYHSANDKDNHSNINNDNKNVDKPLVAKSNFKTYDPNSTTGKKEIESLYQSIQEYWYTNGNDGTEYCNVVVSNGSSFLDEIGKGRIKPNDNILIPAGDYFATETVFTYLNHDDNYTGSQKKYDASSYEVLHLAKPDLPDLFQNSRVSISSNSLDPNDPVAFVWTPRYELENVNSLDTPLVGAASDEDEAKFQLSESWGDSKTVEQKGFQPQNLMKGISAYQNFDNPKQGTFGLKMEDCVLFDEDGSKDTEYDRIVVSGDFSIKNIDPDIDVQISDGEYQKIGFDVKWDKNSTIKTTMGGELVNTDKLVDKLRGANGFKNEQKFLGIDAFNRSGVDFDGRIVLGAVGFNFASGPKVGIDTLEGTSLVLKLKPIIMVMITMDLDGKVSANVVGKYEHDEYNDFGLNIQKEGYGTFDKTAYTKTDNVLGYNIGATSIQAASKDDLSTPSTPAFSLKTSGKAEANIGVSFGPAVMVNGIIPAELRNSVGAEASGEISGTIQNKAPHIQGTAKADVDIYFKLVGQAKFKHHKTTLFDQKWTFIDHKFWEKHFEKSVEYGENVLKGAITDLQSGNAVSNATIKITSKDDKDKKTFEATTGEDGKFTFEGKTGKYMILIRRSGYYDYNDVIDLNGDKDDYNIKLEKVREYPNENNDPTELSGYFGKKVDDIKDDFSNSEVVCYNMLGSAIEKDGLSIWGLDTWEREDRNYYGVYLNQGTIDRIIVEKGKYTVFGLHIGMDKGDALKKIEQLDYSYVHEGWYGLAGSVYEDGMGDTIRVTFDSNGKVNYIDVIYYYKKPNVSNDELISFLGKTVEEIKKAFPDAIIKEEKNASDQSDFNFVILPGDIAVMFANKNVYRVSIENRYDSILGVKRGMSLEEVENILEQNGYERESLSGGDCAGMQQGRYVKGDLTFDVDWMENRVVGCSVFDENVFQAG